jgi:hypothetical protein
MSNVVDLNKNCGDLFICRLRHCDDHNTYLQLAIIIG